MNLVATPLAPLIPKGFWKKGSKGFSRGSQKPSECLKGLRLRREGFHFSG
jgi:hypothetical protein